MASIDQIVDAGEFMRNELLLFAGVGLLIGGIDDLVLDFVYWTRRIWRALTVYRRFPRMTAASLPRPERTGTMAVFIPAWDEAEVIGHMLRKTLARWAGQDVHLFVGVYPNDPASAVAVAAVAARDHRVTLVITDRPGPTSKADCLNALWHALIRWEAAAGREAKAVVLHDAEDVVHRDSIRLMSLMVERFPLVQLPVLPLTDSGSLWIAGHYCDEFAEAHAKMLLVREAVGAALPSAGVGCAVARDAMQRLAVEHNGLPFDTASLTEDYELGLRIGASGGRGVIVRMRDAHGGLIATREYFPDSIAGAVRQKARWTVGIALAGWDRMGWGDSPAEVWMRMHDRRALLAAVVLIAAYAGLFLTASLQIASWVDLIPGQSPPRTVTTLIAVNGALLVWRLAMRALFVLDAYGPGQALLSIPRVVVGNIIAMMAARRALVIYLRHWRGDALTWDKTAHRFPGLVSPGRS